MSNPPLAEAPWVEFQIRNRMKKNDIHVRHARLDCGKYYKGSQSYEISTSEVDNIIIAPGLLESVSSCGRQDSSSGTNGDFNLYDGNTKICNVSWDCCPWSRPANECQIQSYNPETSSYFVILGVWNSGPGAIGNVSITVSLQE
ncbi:Asp-hemolysin [Metarhizium anisopliae]|nr:Asp-hemolysin [Metarhizium anisopliae]